MRDKPERGCERYSREEGGGCEGYTREEGRGFEGYTREEGGGGVMIYQRGGTGM